MLQLFQSFVLLSGDTIFERCGTTMTLSPSHGAILGSDFCAGDASPSTLRAASVKHMGDLQAHSVSSDCIQFVPGDCNVTLKPRLGYVPKSLSTPLRAQVIALPAFIPEEAASSDATPDFALRIYVDRTAQFRQSEQLFVCFGCSTKWLPVAKQRLTHCVVDAVASAYSSWGIECHIGVRAHSTRAVASSLAWTKGVSIKWWLNGLRRIPSPDSTIWICGL